VRLDHLLSKEQLSTKVDSGPHCPNVVVGCSKAETLASLTRQRPAHLVDAACEGWRRNGSVLVRLGRATRDSTLLGPERTTGYGLKPWLFFSARHGLVAYTVSESRRTTSCSWGSGGWLLGLWVGRWLRIAQWTRASCFLWLSCQGRTVDALVPGADEGRGRPR
jgi:hypothetical protein